MQTDALPGDVARIALKFYQSIGTPYSAQLAAMLREKRWMDLAASSPDPRTYSDPRKYFLDSAAAGFLRKFEKLPTDPAMRRQAAIAKWREGETACFRSNERLTRYLPEHKNSVDRDRVVCDVISQARKMIRSWIGTRPPSLVEGRFGPGATFADRQGRTTVPHKMSSDPVMTSDALWFLPQWLGTQWGAFQAQRQREICFVPGNRYSTVPKTALTDRSIAAEPSINVFYQLGLGTELKRRLKYRGHWDLKKAQTLHRQVAESSSVSREFATLDLSNASDTVCKTLVKILLPHAWFEVLDSLRSKKTLIDGKWVVLEKFSSMGNGFTFELETIIFAALSAVVTRKCGHGGWLGRDVFVFGDDIIVKSDVARPLKLVLEFFGFSLNDDKSFYGDEGFRESCGGDFFAGLPVRPYFLKEDLEEPQDFIAVANGIRSVIQNGRVNHGVELGNSAWFAALDSLPIQVRNCRGPTGYGDIVIHDDQERWTFRNRRGNKYIRVYRPHRMRSVKFDRFDPEIVLACATYGTGNWNEGVIPRDGVLSYKVGWMLYEISGQAEAQHTFSKILPDGSMYSYLG